jgi:hypothetical protein
MLEQYFSDRDGILLSYVGVFVSRADWACRNVVVSGMVLVGRRPYA